MRLIEYTLEKMRTRIHVWGGLGSQLYAFALLLTLQKRYPTRKFKIVFHTGGVTERQPEIVPLIKNLCTWVVQHDFQKSHSELENQTLKQSLNLDPNFKIHLKNGLLKFGFVKLCNESFPLLYPWTFSIRGHYRHLSVPNEVLVEIFSTINSQIQEIKVLRRCSVHFRLGDLIGLKQTISPGILKKLLGEIAGYEGVVTKIDIYSDSPELAQQMLVRADAYSEFTFPELDIWPTLINCLGSRYFIGTNSKISYWVSYLRLSFDAKAFTQLPADLKSDFENTLGDLSKYDNLTFYPAEYAG
jgi:hypothetical protein